MGSLGRKRKHRRGIEENLTNDAQLSSSDSETEDVVPLVSIRKRVTASVAPAEAIRNMRREQSTIGNYKGKINRIRLFFLSVDDHNVIDRVIDDGGELKVPLIEEDIKHLFSWLSINTDLPKRRKPPRVEIPSATLATAAVSPRTTGFESATSESVDPTVNTIDTAENIEEFNKTFNQIWVRNNLC